MKRYLFMLALAAAFTSCKKKDDVPECNCTNTNPVTTTASANDYFKLAIGNYWVYQTYSVDTNGVEVLQPSSTQDSSYVFGDTVINGNTYYKLFDFYYTDILRDSSGFMVDPSGAIHFSDVVFNVPLAFNYYGGNIGYNEQMTVSPTVSVTVPAGTFTAYDWKITSHFTDPSYLWDPIRYAHDYYSSGIGKVKQVYFYYSQPGHYERRLIRYHVQ